MFRLRLLLPLVFIICSVCIASAQDQASDTTTPQTAEQYTKSGNTYAANREYDKAVDAYRQAIKLNPNLAAAYQGLGGAYVNMGRVADALEPMKTAVRLDPNNATAHLNLGITFAALRQPDNALSELNEAKRLSPNEPRIYNEIGNVLHNNFGRIDDALASYIEARRLNPNVSAVQHNIGLMYVRLGRYSEAIEPFQQALKLNPEYRNARFFLSDAYSKTGRYPEAIESWTRFLEVVPNGPDALTNRSWDYLYEGDHGAEAAADARKFIEVRGWREERSGFMVVIAYLGYREARMLPEALAIIEEGATKINSARWPYSIIRYLKGDIDVAQLLELASTNDKRTEAHAYIGMDLMLKGNTGEARKHFEWVRDYGNKRYFEYPLAIEELKRIM